MSSITPAQSPSPNPASSASAPESVVHDLTREPRAPLLARVVSDSKDLAEGTLRAGPKHTWHAIKQKPVQYVGLLAGVGGVGAGFMAAGVNPEPFTVGFSALVCGWSAWKALPEMRAAEGPARLRLIGANILWPAALASVTTTAGLLLVGHGAQAAAVPSATDIAQAGAQSAVIGSDVPTIVQTVLDVPEPQGTKRGLRARLLDKLWS